MNSTSSESSDSSSDEVRVKSIAILLTGLLFFALVVSVASFLALALRDSDIFDFRAGPACRNLRLGGGPPLPTTFVQTLLQKVPLMSGLLGPCLFELYASS